MRAERRDRTSGETDGYREGGRGKEEESPSEYHPRFRKFQGALEPETPRLVTWRACAAARPRVCPRAHTHAHTHASEYTHNVELLGTHCADVRAGRPEYSTLD